MFVHVIGFYIHVGNSINRIRCMRMLCMPFIILIEYCFSQFHICILFCIFCIRISNWMCAVFCAFIWCWPFCFKVFQSHCFGCIAVAIKEIYIYVRAGWTLAKRCLSTKTTICIIKHCIENRLAIVYACS